MLRRRAPIQSGNPVHPREHGSIVVAQNKSGGSQVSSGPHHINAPFGRDHQRRPPIRRRKDRLLYGRA